MRKRKTFSVHVSNYPVWQIPFGQQPFLQHNNICNVKCTVQIYVAGLRREIKVNGSIQKIIVAGLYRYFIPFRFAAHEIYIPMGFHKEQQPFYDLFLFMLIVSKSIPVDMDMQSAGTSHEFKSHEE